MFRSVFFIMLLALSASASAQDFNYNYFSLGYSSVDFDDINVDGDGLALRGSYAISENVHVFAGYQDADLDFSVDASTWNIGVGYNTSVSETVDVVARLSYENVEINIPGPGSADENGYGLGVGLRYAAGDKLEFEAGISYVDLSDAGDDTSLDAGVLYELSDTVALGLSGRWSDDFSIYTISGRFYFGQ